MVKHGSTTHKILNVIEMKLIDLEMIRSLKQMIRSSLNVLLVFSYVTIPITGITELLDPKSKPRPFLDRLEVILDRHGIDIARNLSSLEIPTKIEKPRLGYLSDLPMAKTDGSRLPESWQADFKKGVIGGVVSISEANSKVISISEVEFHKLWKQTKKSNRIFISYTGSDHIHAMNIKSCIEAKGYAAFCFLSKDGSEILTSAKKAGVYFREAGMHLVIDTKAARNSSGVLVEYLLTSSHSSKRSEEKTKTTLADKIYKELTKDKVLSKKDNFKFEYFSKLQPNMNQLINADPNLRSLYENLERLQDAELEDLAARIWSDRILLAIKENAINLAYLSIYPEYLNNEIDIEELLRMYRSFSRLSNQQKGALDNNDALVKSRTL